MDSAIRIAFDYCTPTSYGDSYDNEHDDNDTGDEDEDASGKPDSKYKIDEQEEAGEAEAAWYDKERQRPMEVTRQTRSRIARAATRWRAERVVEGIQPARCRAGDPWILFVAIFRRRTSEG